MSFRLEELARLVLGKLIGDGATEITGAAPLGEAGPGQITFVDSAEKSRPLEGASASAAVIPPGVDADGLPAIEVDDPFAAFLTIYEQFRPRRKPTHVGVSPDARVSPTAQLGPGVDVHPGATIGDDAVIGPGVTIHTGVHVMAGCRIAEHVTIYPGAVLYEDTVVGPRCIIHACAVLGADGFGYRVRDGRHEKIPQLGWVEIGADVEIGPGSTIDRGTFGPTRIGEGTKIDDQVMIAHNCQIGPHNILCSQSGVAGSASTGAYVTLAGQAGVRDHVHLGDRSLVAAMSGVMGDVPAGTRMFGAPAFPEREFFVRQAQLAKVREMRRQLRALERKVDELARADDSDESNAAA